MCIELRKYRYKEHKSKLHCIFLMLSWLISKWSLSKKLLIQTSRYFFSLNLQCILAQFTLHGLTVKKKTINHTTELEGCSQHNSPTCVVRYGMLVGILRNCFTARGQCDNHILSSISSPSFDCILLPWKTHLTFKCFPAEIKMHFISAIYKNFSPIYNFFFCDIWGHPVTCAACKIPWACNTSRKETYT